MFCGSVILCPYRPGTGSGFLGVIMKTMGRKRIWGIAAIAAVILPIGIWAAMRRTSPIEFIGDRPQGAFLFKEDTRGKPLIDLGLPGGNRLVFPKKHLILTPTVDPDLVCGYLEWQDFTSPEPYRPSNGPFCDAVAESTTSMPAAGTLLSGLPSKLIALPFAIDPSHRMATLHIGSKAYTLKLPVTKGLGPSLRTTTRWRTGPYEVVARPRPWLLSTAPIDVDVQVIGPAGKPVTLMIGGVVTLLAGNSGPDMSTGDVTALSEYTLDDGESATLSILPHNDPILSGWVSTLVEKQVLLSAHKSRGGWQLLMPDGSAVYGPGSVSIRRYSFRAMRAYQPGGSAPLYTFLPNRIHQRRSPKLNEALLREGMSIRATAYFSGKQWPFKLPVDVPVRPPFHAPHSGLTMGYWMVL